MLHLFPEQERRILELLLEGANGEVLVAIENAVIFLTHFSYLFKFFKVCLRQFKYNFTNSLLSENDRLMTNKDSTIKAIPSNHNSKNGSFSMDGLLVQTPNVEIYPFFKKFIDSINFKNP